MSSSAEQVISQYKTAYQRLYDRTPQYLYVLDRDWVIVNGARMRATELQYVVQRLDEEYKKQHAKSQSVVHRLIAWLKN
jgi:hypothetical protein